MGNSYFGHGKSQVVAENVEVNVKGEIVKIEPQQEFKQYEDGIKHETIKGLTSIIIPAWLNSYPVFHTLGNCIGSIREHTDKQATPYEIILVLQGEGLKMKPEDTLADKVIELETNVGFATAVNKGIRVAFGEYIAVVNSDVQVYDYWLGDMQEALQFDLNLVMATPMYGMPFARAVEAVALREATLGREPNDFTFKLPIAETFSDFRDFSCVLTRKALFDQIGLFDEQFFMYGEDLDLMKRMDKEGLKYASTKRVRTHHIIGQTSSGDSKTPAIMDESRAKLKAKWGE